MKIFVLFILFLHLHGLDVVKIDKSNYGVVHLLENNYSIDGSTTITIDELADTIVKAYENKTINNALAFSFSDSIKDETAINQANTLIKKVVQKAGIPFYSGRLGVSDEVSNSFGGRVSSLGIR